MYIDHSKTEEKGMAIEDLREGFVFNEVQIGTMVPIAT